MTLGEIAEAEGGPLTEMRDRIEALERKVSMLVDVVRLNEAAT